MNNWYFKFSLLIYVLYLSLVFFNLCLHIHAFFFLIKEYMHVLRKNFSRKYILKIWGINLLLMHSFVGEILFKNHVRSFLWNCLFKSLMNPTQRSLPNFKEMRHIGLVHVHICHLWYFCYFIFFSSNYWATILTVYV